VILAYDVPVMAVQKDMLSFMSPNDKRIAYAAIIQDVLLKLIELTFRQWLKEGLELGIYYQVRYRKLLPLQFL
jgi:hypothetical protein